MTATAEPPPKPRKPRCKFVDGRGHRCGREMERSESGTWTCPTRSPDHPVIGAGLGTPVRDAFDEALTGPVVSKWARLGQNIR